MDKEFILSYYIFYYQYEKYFKMFVDNFMSLVHFTWVLFSLFSCIICLYVYASKDPWIIQEDGDGDLSWNGK